ncbi:MAG: hypothetical protein JXR71_07725 [Bacteroidales bacterium]|nr:hypothetical protein [Bacteroidales bacterium]
MKNRCSVTVVILIAVNIFQWACSSTTVLRQLAKADEIQIDSKKNEYLKVHMKDGGLFVLSVDQLLFDQDSVTGDGNYFNARRQLTSPESGRTGTINFAGGFYRIAFADIALIEANTVTGLEGKWIALGLVGAQNVILTVYCIANPKACFGSCPTFYAWDGEGFRLMAEGFSSSILRAFEKQDIDMLHGAKTYGDDFQLRITNEALETHVIRYANLLVFPKADGERIFATEKGNFFQSKTIVPPSSCSGPEGDCLTLVSNMDARERFSEANSKNLAAKEYLEMEFENVPDVPWGLVLGTRQTLLTTYLFYQGLAITGQSNGYLAARIESGDQSLRKRVEKIWDILGGIEIELQDNSGKWQKVGKINEMGPIAPDVHVVTIPRVESEKLRIRLKMTQGLWRIDYAALAALTAPVYPVEIRPYLVKSEGRVNEDALTALCDSIEPLITLPGDAYELHYELPDNAHQYEVFLKTKGYYLEWLRDEWQEEADLKKAFLMYRLPRLYLKLVAAKFKEAEPTMEEIFWNSRYVKN